MRLRLSFIQSHHCFKQVSIIARLNALVSRDIWLTARIDFVLVQLAFGRS